MPRKNKKRRPEPSKPVKGESPPRRVVNVRLLLATIAAGLVFPIAAYGWHAFQVGRIATAFLDRASALEKEGNWREAAHYVHRFIGLCPESSEEQIRARIRLAKDYDEFASTGETKTRAIELHYEALGVATGVASRPELLQLRRRLSELLLEQRRFVEAEVEALKLIAADRQDADALRVLATALFGQYQAGELAGKHGAHLADDDTFAVEGLSDEARERLTTVRLAAGGAFQVATVGDAFEVAVALNPPDALNPQDIRLAATWARILRDEPELLSDNQLGGLATRAAEENKSEVEIRQSRADHVMDRIVSSNDQKADAYLARYEYRDRYGLPGAEDDLHSALDCEPANVTASLVAARHYQRQAEQTREEGAPADVNALYDTAIAHYKDAIKHGNPPTVDAFAGLGDVYSAQGKSDEAIATWQEGLASLGDLDVTLNARLAGELIAADRLAEAEQALRRFEKGKSQFESRLIENARLAWNRSGDLLQAQLLLKKGKPLQAVPLLRPISTSGLSEAPERSRAWLLLAESYAALGRWDQAASAYENAVDLDAKLDTVRLAAANAWLKANQPKNAIQHFEQVLARNNTVALQFQLAGARFAYQVTLPLRNRNWGPFENALSNIVNADYQNELSGEAWRVELLQVDYAMARSSEREQPDSSDDEAVALLRQAEQAYADVAPFWREATLRYERMGQTAEADRALARCEALAGSSAATKLLASRIYAGRKQYKRARQVLRDGLSSLPAEERFGLRLYLAQISVLEGSFDQAKRELEELHQADPSDMSVLLQLAELALDTDDVTGAERWEGRLNGVEGPDGTLWRYVKARRLLSAARSAAAPEDREAMLRQSESLLAEVQSRRPSWSAGYLLKGSLAERRGDLDGAAEAYRVAIRLGEQRVSVYERLAGLLLKLGRLADALEYLSVFGNRIESSESLSPLAIRAAMGQRDLSRAEALAKRFVETRPADSDAWLRYGIVLLANEHKEEAEAAFRKAVELAPNDTSTWNGLFSFQLWTKQPEQARETLLSMARQAELTDAQRAFVLAQGYELLGDDELAEAKYREAAGTEHGRESVAILARMAAFYLRRDPRQAEQVLRQLMELAQRREDTRWAADGARRTLAGLLAARGGDGDFREAMELLAHAGADRQVAELDKRLQAVLLTQRSDPELGRAQQLLEELVRDIKTKADGDRVLLAWVYLKQSESLEGEDKYAKVQAAREQYETLCMRSEPKASHLAQYVALLMDRTKWEDPAQSLRDADPLLRRLEEVAPDHAQTVFLRARWLDQQGRRAEIGGIVEPWAKRLEGQAEEDEQRLQIYLSAGNVYSAHDLHSAAEPWYRKALALDAEQYPPLAQSLARQGKMAEAVRLCADRAKKADAPWPATVLATVLVAGQAKVEDFQVAQPILAKALSDFGDDPELLLAVANLRVVQGRIDEATGFYKNVIRLRPKNLVAINNLATLLSEQPGKVQEALRYIDQAIDIAGPKPALLDTKGMALVYNDRPREAIGVLKQAVAEPDADPRFHFHLAVALQRAGQTDEARTAFAAAANNDLHGQLLTDADRRLLEELEGLFGKE